MEAVLFTRKSGHSDAPPIRGHDRESGLGTMEELKAHAETKRKRSGMVHDEPHIGHVPPGKQGEIGRQSTDAGEFYYACLVPGDFDAGLIGKVTVSP